MSKSLKEGSSDVCTLIPSYFNSLFLNESVGGIGIISCCRSQCTWSSVWSKEGKVPQVTFLKQEGDWKACGKTCFGMGSCFYPLRSEGFWEASQIVPGRSQQCLARGLLLQKSKGWAKRNREKKREMKPAIAGYFIWPKPSCFPIAGAFRDSCLQIFNKTQNCQVVQKKYIYPV